MNANNDAELTKEKTFLFCSMVAPETDEARRVFLLHFQKNFTSLRVTLKSIPIL